jgi:dethiobiotin synthetase
MTTGKGIFITGTNTAVGKTVVTRGVARLLTNKGVDVAAIKPVESGVDQVEHSDAFAICRAAGRGHSPASVTAYSFRTPVSPHLAAAIENRHIDEDIVVSFLKGWLSQAEVVLAEGAGGLLVPLNSRITYADAIAQTRYTLLIVAPDILGTINATLLTIEAARARGIAVAGVVLNRATSSDRFGNREAISCFGRVPILGTVPELDAEDDLLADKLEGNLDLERFFSLLLS